MNFPRAGKQRITNRDSEVGIEGQKFRIHGLIFAKWLDNG